MPVTGRSKLIPTIDDFLAHWALVERATAASGPLMVLDGVGREGLIALRAQLEAGPVDVAAATAELRQAREELREQCRRMRAAMKWFNAAVRADFPESKWL